MKALYLVMLLYQWVLLGCVTKDSEFEKGPVKFDVFSGVTKSSLEVSTFKKPGPFSVKVVEDYSISVNPNLQIVTDLYQPSHADRAPLVVFSHGNKASKEAHRVQASRIASWGYYALALSLPNRNQWLTNAKRIEKLIAHLRKNPGIISQSVNIDKIILVGHSFGGSAVSAAAGSGASVLGLVLLDPALVHESIKKYLKKVRVPVMVLGADRDVFRSRKRNQFYKNIGSNVFEASVVGATHNDAQYPSMFESNFGFDLFTSKTRQETFLSHLLLSIVSLSETGGFTYAWLAMERNFRLGELKMSRRK